MDNIALSQCFNKHSFSELNSFDDSMIFKSLCKAQTIFTYFIYCFIWHQYSDQMG